MTDGTRLHKRAAMEDMNLRSRVKEMQAQVGTLSTLTTVTLIFALLLVVLYILDMLCGPRVSARSPSSNLPTAVVIQPKESEDVKKQHQKREHQRDDCKHNSNRHFPSKSITLELLVKKADLDREQKEKEKEKEALDRACAVVSIPLGAPPTYAESKKDVLLASGAAEKQQPTQSAQAPPKIEPTDTSKKEATTGQTGAAEPTASMSTTQDASLSKAVTPDLTTPKTAEPPAGAKAEKVAPTVPTQTKLSVAAPALPVPAKPPIIPSNKFSVLAPSGRRPTSKRSIKKPSGRTPIQKTARMGTQSTTTTRTLLSMSSTASQDTTKADNASKLQARKATPNPTETKLVKRNT